MAFGHKTKVAMMQQRQQMAVLQAQVHMMQNQQRQGPMGMPMPGPEHHHHHTREIVNNVPQFIPMEGASTFMAPPATFMAPQMPPMSPHGLPMGNFMEPQMPPMSPLVAVAEQVPFVQGAEPWGPMSPVMPPMPMGDPMHPQGGVEYRCHQQNMDGTWTNSSWWE